MKRKWLGVALEAIDHQDGKFFEELTEKFREVRRKKVYTDSALAELGIAAVIQKHSGISVKMEVWDANYINAAVMVPSLDQNNPLLNNFERWYRSSDDLKDFMKMKDVKKFVGGVDNKTGRVTGDFTKLTVPMYITKGALKDESLLPEELAAIMLHECGHVYTYCERLVDMVSYNYAVKSVMDRIFKLDSDEKKMELLYEFDKIAGVELPNKETIVKSGKTGTVYARLISELPKQRRNAEGTEIYSYRGFEFSSDQFSTRHGAGRYLITGLDKLYGGKWADYRNGWVIHTAKCLINTVSSLAFGIAVVSVLGTPAALVPWVAISLWTIFIHILDPRDKIYDEPLARAERIRREILDRLKDKYLDKGERVRILEDLKTIDACLEGCKDRRTWLEAYWEYILPSGRESRKLMEFQQSIERLASNELFAAAAMYRA